MTLCLSVECWGYKRLAFNERHSMIILWPRQTICHAFEPSVCGLLSVVPALEVSYSRIRSSLVYGPGGSSTPWWPAGRAPGWGAGGLRRSVIFPSQLRWLMSLKNKICHVKKKTKKTTFYKYLKGHVCSFISTPYNNTSHILYLSLAGVVFLVWKNYTL